MKNINIKKCILIAVAASAVVVFTVYFLTLLGHVGNNASVYKTAGFDKGFGGFAQDADFTASEEVADEASKEQSFPGGVGVDTEAVENGEKLVYNADISLETKRYTDHKKAIESAFRDYNVIIESMNENGGSSNNDYRHGNRSGMVSSWTVRVPYEDFDGLYDELVDKGNGWSVISAHANVSNLTEQYSLNASYIESYTAEKEALLKLIEEADKIPDILEIHDRLASINGELKYYTDENSRIDSEVGYSTITVTLSEVKNYSSERIEFRTKLGEAVHDAWYLFATFITLLLLFVVRYSLFILLFLAIALVVFFVRRRRGNRRASEHSDKSGDGDQAGQDS